MLARSAVTVFRRCLLGGGLLAPSMLAATQLVQKKLAVEEGQRVIRESGLGFTVAKGMKDAAEKVVALAA